MKRKAYRNSPAFVLLAWGAFFGVSSIDDYWAYYVKRTTNG